MSHPILENHAASKGLVKARAEATAGHDQAVDDARQHKVHYDEAMADAVRTGGAVPAPPPTEAHAHQVRAVALERAEAAYRQAIGADVDRLLGHVETREDEILNRAGVLVAELDGLVDEARNLDRARMTVRDVAGLEHQPATSARISWDTLLDAVRRDRFLMREPYAGWHQTSNSQKVSA
jgi:hypothetical protein